MLEIVYANESRHPKCIAYHIHSVPETMKDHNFQSNECSQIIIIWNKVQSTHSELWTMRCAMCNHFKNEKPWIIFSIRFDFLFSYTHTVSLHAFQNWVLLFGFSILAHWKLSCMQWIESENQKRPNQIILNDAIFNLFSSLFCANSMNIISKTLSRTRCLPFPFLGWSLKNVNKIHRTMKFIFLSSNQFDHKSNVI